MPDRLTQCPYLDIARRNREERGWVHVDAELGDELLVSYDGNVGLCVPQHRVLVRNGPAALILLS